MISLRLFFVAVVAGMVISVMGYGLVAVTNSSDVAQTRVIERQVLSAERVHQAVQQQEQMVVFNDDVFGYHLDYPFGWQVIDLAGNVILFQSPSGVERLTVEAIESIPVDGLASFVDSRLGDDLIFSRQSLTIHGQTAERVVSFSEIVGVQRCMFFVEGQGSVFVITGVGEQGTIELMGRSFNAPQAVALR